MADVTDENTAAVAISFLLLANLGGILAFVVSLIASGTTQARYTGGVGVFGGPAALFDLAIVWYIKSDRVTQPGAWCGPWVLASITVVALVVQAISFFFFALSDIKHHKIG